jgi:DNA-directed RNA polymerase specialized sigma24 family protein
LVELAAPERRAYAAPAAAEHELEPEGSRWAGWWKDDLPATPDAEGEALEDAIASLEPLFAAMILLRDVEGLDADEVEALFGHTHEFQIAVLHEALTTVRNRLRATAEAAS